MERVIKTFKTSVEVTFEDFKSIKIEVATHVTLRKERREKWKFSIFPFSMWKESREVIRYRIIQNIPEVHSRYSFEKTHARNGLETAASLDFMKAKDWLLTEMEVNYDRQED
jgi:hypothetical protein